MKIKISIVLLVLANIITMAFAARWWLRCTVWQNLMFGMASYTGRLQAREDVGAGKAKFYKSAEDVDLEATGRMEGSLEVWHWPYHSELGVPDKYSSETFVRSYNKTVQQLLEQRKTRGYDNPSAGN